MPYLSHTSPGRLLVLSLLFVIGGGTWLLNLSICQTASLSFLDILFTTVSTVCVTGLNTIPLSSFSTTGQWVILALMQIGGLGFMTFSFFLASLFLNLGMTSKLLAGELLEFETWSKIRAFLVSIVLVTLCMEGIGAYVLYHQFKSTMPLNQAFFYSIFHSVSAFCNAGLSLFDNSMTTFATSPQVLLTLAALIIAGGIGFIVWYELAKSLRHLWSWIRGRACPLFSFSLHTKLAITTSLLLISFGTLCIWGIEYSHSLSTFKSGYGFLNALFMSISMRSAGFTVINIAHTANATLLILLGLMFIGSSPGSTGSGIKTTTFALFCATIRAIIQNRSAVELNGRTIPTDQMYKVIAIMAIAFSWLILSSFVLLLLEPKLPFLQLIVESVSAFTTCGISMGITASLSIASKVLLMASMMLGRVGMLTLVLSLRGKKQKYSYRYPEERVLLG